MPLPPEAIEDMRDSFRMLKRRMVLSFSILSPKKASGVPWIVVARKGKSRRRFMKARKIARKGQVLSPRKVAHGTVERMNGRLVFVYSEKDTTIRALGSRLTKRWPKKLKQEEAKELKKLAVLLRRAMVVSEEERRRSDFEVAPLDDPSSEGRHPEVRDARSRKSERREGADSSPRGESSLEDDDLLGDDELDEIFGVDRLDVVHGVHSLKDLQRRVPSPEVSQPPRRLATALVQRLSEPGAVMGEPDELITYFSAVMSSEVAGDGVGFEEGIPLPFKDRVAFVAVTYGHLMREIDVWEETVEQAEEMKAQLDEWSSDYERRRSGLTRAQDWDLYEDYGEGLAEYNDLVRRIRVVRDKISELESSISEDVQGLAGTLG